MFPKKSSLIFRADRNDTQHHRYRPTLRIANVVLYMLALVGITLALLWRAWQMNSLSTWLYFYVLAFGLVTSVLALAQTSRKGAINHTAIIHAIANSDDQTLAPAADEQPVPFADLTTLPAQEAIGTLDFLGTGSFTDVFASPSTTTTNTLIPSFLLSSSANWIYFWSVLIFFLMSSPVSGDVFGLQERFSGGPFAFILPLVPLGGLIVFFGAFLFVVQRKRFSITIEHTGIRWQRRDDVGSAYHLTWDAIRAFIFVKILKPKRPRSTDFTYAYLLIGDEAVFVWGAKADINSRIAANYLAKLVVTRTGLMLRDMSAFAAEISQTKGHNIYDVLAKYRADVPVIADIMNVIDARMLRLQDRLGKAVAYVAVVLVVALVGIAVFANVQQHGYFASLPSRIHARTPSYQATLTPPSNDWPTHAPTAADPRGMRYIDGGYQLYGTEQYQSIVAFGKPTFGEAAVEVTARVEQQNKVDSATIGVALGGDSADYLLFSIQIGGYGFWYINICANTSRNRGDCRHIDTSDLHDSSILHTDDGAANTLMVVIRNDSYVFYINDALIYAFVDAALLLPAQHTLGFNVEGEMPKATYSDLKIYPITTHDFWAYV